MSIARNIRVLLLRILAYSLGVFLEVLSLIFPDATRIFITTQLGISDLTVVSWIIIGMIVFGAIILGLVTMITVAKWAGWNLQRFSTLRKPKPTVTIPPGILDDSFRVGQLLAGFEEAFKNAREMRSGETKGYALEVLRNKLHDLCYGPMGQPRPEWNANVRKSIERFLTWLADEFDNLQYRDDYLDMLNLIVNEKDEGMNETIRGRFLKKVEDLYHDPDFWG